MVSVTDWVDLGILPFQDHDPNVPYESARQMVVGARVSKLPTPGQNPDEPELMEIGLEFDQGTIGDFHPVWFWQTRDRLDRGMGLWTQVMPAVVGDEGGLEPVVGNSWETDKRFYAIGAGYPIQALGSPVKGQIYAVMGSTEDFYQEQVAVNVDPRLVCPSVGGPIDAATKVVDLQPDGWMCVAGGQRVAPLQTAWRVVPFFPGSENIGGGSLAMNFAECPGGGATHGLAWFKLDRSQAGPIRPTGQGPTTGGGSQGPIRPGDFEPTSVTNTQPVAVGLTLLEGGSQPNPTDFGGYESTGGSGGWEVGPPPHEYGEFTAKREESYGTACLARIPTYGPLCGGHAEDKHFTGTRDADGNPLNSGHISVNAYYYKDKNRDGPFLFEGDYPDPPNFPLQTRVHLTWDSELRHEGLGEDLEGQWRWYAEAPTVAPQGPPTYSVPTQVPPTGGGGGGGGPRRPSGPTPSGPGPGNGGPTRPPGEPPARGPSGPVTPAGPSGPARRPGGPLRPETPRTGGVPYPGWVAPWGAPFPPGGKPGGGPTKPVGGPTAAPPSASGPSKPGGLRTRPNATGGNTRDPLTRQPSLNKPFPFYTTGVPGVFNRAGTTGTPSQKMREGSSASKFFWEADVHAQGRAADTARNQQWEEGTNLPDRNATGFGRTAPGPRSVRMEVAETELRREAVTRESGIETSTPAMLGSFPDPDGYNNSPTQQELLGAVNEVGLSAGRKHLYTIHHPMHESFSALSIRPQLWIQGFPNFERTPLLPGALYKADEAQKPAGITMRAWGAQANGDWVKLEDTEYSRVRGGYGHGGLLLCPPQFEMEDYLSIGEALDPDTVSNNQAMFTFAKGISLAFGKPDIATGLIADGGVQIRRESDAEPLVIENRLPGAPSSDVLKIVVDGSEQMVSHSSVYGVQLPVGDDAQRPSALVNEGIIRYNSDLEAVEYYNAEDWLPVGSDSPVLVPVYNNTGSTLAKGKPVYVTGSHTSGKPYVALANATTGNPAIGLVYKDIAGTGNLEGFVVVSGTIHMNTSAYNDGDALYLTTTDGDLATSRPTGNTDKVQKVALVTRKAGGNAGRLLVMGAGRTNDINNELVALTGVDARTEADLGTFTGTTIADNETIKGALQDLETAVENVSISGDISSSGLTMSGQRLLGNADTSTGPIQQLVLDSDDFTLTNVDPPTLSIASVTTSQIAGGAVTEEKLASGGQYHGTYNATASTQRTAGDVDPITCEVYYTARPDGDGYAESEETATPPAGARIVRRLYFSDKFNANPTTSADWTAYTTQPADGTSFATAKASLLAGLNDTDATANTRGTLPVSLKMEYEAVVDRLLDDYPGAEAAYSVRLIDKDYSGPCMRVRNVNTNATADIGFDSNGDLDEPAIATLCGAYNGAVEIWYDQSGGGHHQVQETTTLQPFIYLGGSPGAVLKENGKPVIVFTDGGQLQNVTHSTVTVNLMATFGSASPTPGTTFAVVGPGGDYSSFSNFIIGTTSGGGAYYGFCTSSGTGVLSPNFTATFRVNQTLQSSPTRTSLYTAIDPQAVVTASWTATVAGPLRWYINYNYSFAGSLQVQEYVIYYSDKSSDQAAIEDAINDYYGAYV